MKQLATDPWTDIDAFTRNSKISLDAWELEMVEMLDDLWLAQQVKTIKANTPST